MRGLVIDTAHDDALVDLIDTPRRARRRSDAAKIRRMLYRSSPAGTPNKETALGVRGDFKNQNNRPPLWQQGGVGKPSNILNDGPELARQSPSLPVNYDASSFTNFAATPPNASNDPRTEQSLADPLMSANGVLPTDAIVVHRAREDSDDEQANSFGKENSKPIVSDPPRRVHHLSPLLSSASLTLQPTVLSNTHLESNFFTKEQPSFLSDNVPSTSISAQVSDISEHETPCVLAEEASHPTTSSMSENGGVADTIDMQHGLYLPSSLTGTNTSMTGSSVDADALVEEFIGGKNINDDPDVNMEDFDSYGSSRDSILMSSSIKDAKILPTFERSLNSDGDFDLNLHQIHLNNSSLSFSSRGDMTAIEKSRNESSVDSFDVNNGNKPFKTFQETPNVPSPPRPTNPLKKKPAESRKINVMPAVRARRFRLRSYVRNDAVTRNSSPSAKSAEENRSDVSDPASNLSKRDLPPLPSVTNPQAGVTLTDLGSNTGKATTVPSPMQETKDIAQITVSPTSISHKPVQKVYSYYTPVAPLDFVENRPPGLFEEGFPTVQTAMDSSSDSNEKMPSPILKSELPVSDDSDQMVSVLRSNSYSKAETEPSTAIATNDDMHVPDIPPTVTDQTVGRNNGHPPTEHANEIETESPSPIERNATLPDEDIDVSDSSSCDAVLEFDSIRLFERQVEAQMQRMGADTSKCSKEDKNDSDELESDTNANTTLVVSMRVEDLACPPPNDEGISQSARQITEVETTKVPPNSSRELVPSQEEFKMLREAVIQLDAALERQRVVLKTQRREIASLKKERDLLRADLKASRALPRSKCQDDPLVTQCVGKMGIWSSHFSSSLKCE